MKYRIVALTVVVIGLLGGFPAGVAVAQDQPPEQGSPPPDQSPRPRNPEFHQRMLDEFDKDGNGQLDEQERQVARETMRARREERRERFGGRGPDEARGPRGPEGRARRPGPGAGGPANRDRSRPRLESLFGWFDRNNDQLLDREEFRELAQFVQRRHQDGPPRGGPEGRGFGRRGPGGGPPPPGEGFGRRGPGGPPPPYEAGPPGPPPDDASVPPPGSDEATVDELGG